MFKELREGIMTMPQQIVKKQAKSISVSISISKK